MSWASRTDLWLRTHPRVLDVSLTALLLPTLGWKSLDILRACNGPTWVVGTAAAASATLHIAGGFWRRAPEVAFATASVCALVLALLPDVAVAASDVGISPDPTPLNIPLIFLPSAALFLLALLGVSAFRPPRVAGVALGIGILGAALCTARVSVSRGAIPDGWLALVASAAALGTGCAGAWALGRLMAEGRRRQRADATRSRDAAVAAERERVAHDLHDILGHALAVIVRQAEGGLAISAHAPERVSSTFGSISHAARDAMREMRASLALLEHGEAGLFSENAVATLVSRAREAGADVSLAVEGVWTSLSPAAAGAAHRTLQEGLTNAVKHADIDAPIAVSIVFGATGCVVTVVNGRGNVRQPAEGGLDRGGYGLTGLRRRVVEAGGRFDAGPCDGGFRVRASFPMKVAAP